MGERCEIGKKTELGQQGATSCQSCGAGEYGQSCDKCSSGTYRSGSDGDATVCKDCPAGYHQDQEGRAACLPCIPGLYQDQLGKLKCKKCGADHFMPDSNATQCLSCGSGKSTNVKEGQIICQSCPAGKYGDDCSDCAAGKYREVDDNIDAGKCKSCPAGFYQEYEGKSLCFDCIPGMYSKNSESNICTNCNRGQYRSGEDKNASQCLHCPTGFYQGRKGSTTCEPKMKGWILKECNKDDGDTECKKTEQCAIGTYQNDSKSTVICQECPIGWSSSQGTTKCQTCNKGEYGKKDGICYKCKSGRFGPKLKAKKCDDCPSGWSQPTEGSESCIDLKWKKAEDCQAATQYLNASDVDGKNWECAPCPLGGSCEVDVTWEEVGAKFGYYRLEPLSKIPPDCLLIPEIAKNLAEPRCAFASCPYPPACLGAKNDEYKNHFFEPGTGNDLSQPPLSPVKFNNSRYLEMCDEEKGYSNGIVNTTNSPICSNISNVEKCKSKYRLCGTCKEGYKRISMSSTRCKKCPDPTANKILLGIGFSVMIVGSVILIILTIQSEGGTDETSDAIKKIILNYLQIASLAGGLPLKWPEEVNTLFSTMATLASAGSTLLIPDW
jgi:hypothetical protein